MSSNKQILTIDLDYIMEPCIQLYNSKISELSSHKQSWDRIFNENKCQSFLSINESNRDFIVDIITKSKCPIYIGLDHTSILRMFDDLYNSDENLSPPFEIINIDHHHDCGYDPESTKRIIEYKYAQCGNWVELLHQEKLIDKYTWVKNPNSILPKVKSNIVSVIDQDTFINEYAENNYYALYITPSFNWIPPQFLPAVYDILTIAENQETFKQFYTAYYEQYKTQMQYYIYKWSK